MKKRLLGLAAAGMLLLMACACGSPAASGPAAPAESGQPSESVSAASGEENSAASQNEAAGTPESGDPAEPGSSAEEPTASAALPEENASSESEEEQSVNAVIVYFSWSGNTRAAAEEIGRQTGADLFELTPAEPYTSDYNALLDIAQEERQNNARPAISGDIDLSKYDTVFIGYPIWWGDMPMILYTFLDQTDLSGKTVLPFVTSGGSGLSGTVGAIREAEPDAVVTEGLSISGSAAANCAGAVAEWLGANYSS